MNEKDTVLVIDDDVTMLKMAESMLEPAYSVSLAKSGRQALRLLEKGFKPGIILLDIDMPEMDGFETMGRLKQLEHLQATPVVYLTGLKEPAFELKGLHSGAADYITKPFVREILLARMQMHLENGRQKRHLELMQETRKKTDIDEAHFERVCQQLTGTEQKVARLIALGYTNNEIGEELGYTYAYVKKVATIVFDKLNVNKRVELRRLLK